MRTYIVQSGDTPTGIAARFAGCPKCAADLVSVNRHKTSITLPNGYSEPFGLTPGETLNLPDKWFNGMLDTQPKSYFDALPGPGGGMLADFNRAQFGLGPGPVPLTPPLRGPAIGGFATYPSNPPPPRDFFGAPSNSALAHLLENSPGNSPGSIRYPGPATGGVSRFGPPVVSPGKTRATAPESSAPMSTGTKVAIGLGVVAALGAAWWALS